jgi:transmembrane sensor
MMESHAAEEPTRFEEACDWFLRLREAPESVELVNRWLAWYRSDARNRRAFEQVREMWRTTGVMPVQPEVSIRAARTSPAGKRATSHWRTRLLAVAAAALFATLGALLYAGRFFSEGTPPSTSTFTTAQSERRGFQLADGSFVDLAGDSVLRVTLHEHRRELELERGEAYFRVAHDKTRPFVVHAGAFHVRAVGTSFDVRTSADRVVVAVEEGTVVVEPQPRERSAVDSMVAKLRPARRGADAAAQVLSPVHVRGGQEIAVGEPHREVQLLPIEPTAVASWREGRLRFVREPLRSVIESIRAATGRDIELADAQLGELRFTGTVFSTRVEAWAEGLPAIFPVEVREEGAQLVISARR